jgi:alpha-mannosidase
MQTMSANILGNLIKQVKEKIVMDTMPIEEWDTRTGWHRKPGEFTYDDAPHQVMKIGDRWNAGYDQTRWFSADITVPERMNGKKLYLFLNFGGEGIVRLNGKIAGAISKEDGWTARDIILMNNGKSGENFSIEVEETVNSGQFCDRAMAGEKYMIYTIKYSYLGAINEETEQYWYDLITAYESLEFIKDKVIYERVYRAIDESLHMLDFDFDNETFYKSVPAAKKLFNDMMNDIPDAKQGELCMIGHSHLDIAWLWTTRELVRKTARTFSNNIALMDKYPDFKFTQSQAIVYDYMKKYYPEIYAQVKEKVKSGQWEIVGNTWVEADTNLASGESLVRQLLYGREFFMKEFGVSSDVYWLPDCFGFTWAMPQIIKRSGMKYFYTAKLYFNATHKFPYSIFNWKSHSGDEIIAVVQQESYESDYNAPYINNCWERSNQKDITSKAIGAFGYGDGGGGCTYDMVERSKRFEKIPGMPKAKNRFVREFFSGMEDCKQQLPTFNDEMYYENHRGTFTSQAFIKKNNRQGEFLFRNAEFLNVLSNELFGSAYPYEKMDEGWKLLLTNQFHDILPGTSIHEVIEMTRGEYKQMREIGNGLLGAAVENINKNINAEADSVVVWNMNSMPITGSVSVELPFENAITKNADGKICMSTASDGKLTFIANDVPAMGYSTYKLEKGKAESSKVVAQKNLLENSKLKVVFDENGIIDSIYDKANDRMVLTGKGNQLTVFQDKPIHESAWNLELDYQKKFWKLDSADSIEVIESSEVRGVIRIVRSFNKSVITQNIILAADADYIDFETRADWYETEKVLKAAFPVSVTNTHASYEIAHGSIDRPTHWNYGTDLVRFEVCGHKWADLSEGDYGVSIINDCKYGYDIKDNLMRITLMRAPICPDTVGDKGISTFTYRLYPHAGVWSQADTVKYAFELNQPLKGFNLKAQNGELEGNKSFINVDKENIIIDAVKPAQDGNGIIIRVYESEKKRGNVNIKFNFGKIKKVIECNLMEVDENELSTSDNSFNFFITPHQVRTFRII